MLKNFLSVLGLSVVLCSVAVKAEDIPAKPARIEMSSVVQLDDAQISLNNALLAIDRAIGAKITLSPELSSPEMLNKQLELKIGARQLRELLDEICSQIGAYWKLSADGAAVAIEAGKTGAVVAEKSDKPLEVKLDAEYAGVDLSLVAADLQDKAGVVIEVPADLKEKKVEVMVKGWELKRILGHICFLYDLQYTYNPGGKVVISKK